jgi:hypothetical protein
VDLTVLPQGCFGAANTFFCEFTNASAYSLTRGDDWEKTESLIRQRWSISDNNTFRCTGIMSGLLASLGRPAVSLLIDGADRLLSVPFREDFFNLLQTWLKERIITDSPWRNVDIVVATSEEPWMLGLRYFNEVQLSAFSLDDVRTLSQDYKTGMSEDQVGGIMRLLEGHPWLTDLCLKAASAGPVPDFGPEREPLASQLAYIQAQVEKLAEQLKVDLEAAVREILETGKCSDSRAFYQLRSLGIVGRSRKPVRFTCPLYRDYFKGD